MSHTPRFKSLVQLHENRERDIRRQVGVLEQKRAGIQEHIDKLADERHQAALATSLQDRMQLARYWMHIDKQMQTAQKMVAQVEVDIEKLRKMLIEAHRSHAIFKKLQEQDGEQERRRLERRQARQLEEFAALQFIKRREVPL